MGMTEDDCRRVLALWGLTDIEQAVGRADWPWHRNLLRDRGASAVVVSEHARLPDFTKDDAAAVQLAPHVCGRIRSLQYHGGGWWVVDILGEPGANILGGGEHPGDALLEALARLNP